MSISFVIIEDEQPTLEELLYLLEPYDCLTCIGTAHNGEAGFNLIKTKKPDLAFIDVNMPIKNGVDLVKSLKYLDKMPLIIFSTAFREYAVDAFELSAFDYILKPYDEARLDKIIKKLRNHFASLSDISVSVEKQERLAAIVGDRTRLISVASIFYVTTDKEKIVIHSEDGVFETLYSLNEIAEKTELFRIHRGCLVNLKRIIEFYPWFNGTYQVKLNDINSTELTVSRSFVKAFKQELL